MSLADKRCVPCEGGVMPLTIQQAEELIKELDGWILIDSARKIEKKFTFKNFADALAFVNWIGKIAEEENHHPDIAFGWGSVRIELTTHAIRGLSSNDFILGAKIDKIPVV